MKAYDAPISSKGQIVIAHEIRKKLGLSTSHVLRETIENGRVVLTPIKRPSEMGGFLKNKIKKTANQMIKESREGWE